MIPSTFLFLPPSRIGIFGFSVTIAIWIGTVMRIAVIMSGVVVMYPSTLNRPNPNPEEGAVPAPCSKLAELQGTSRTR